MYAIRSYYAEVLRSAIKSDHRFNYEEVQDYLERPQRWKNKLSPQVFQLVGLMHELAMVYGITKYPSARPCMIV